MAQNLMSIVEPDLETGSRQVLDYDPFHHDKIPVRGWSLIGHKDWFFGTCLAKKGYPQLIYANISKLGQFKQEKIPLARDEA
jgi:hypothetical protein